jgi:hypothetical protein
LVWKSLVGIELDDEDLKATDFSCWNALQFRDHDGQGITASTFEALLHQCRFTCCLTDGSEVPLLTGVCVCVRERESVCVGERERETCCLTVCVRERARERERLAASPTGLTWLSC